MARPRSEDKRNAILAAATRVIVSQGLSAPTALIAQEAGVANGSLFTYFETKTDLWNQLYLHLKGEMAAAMMAGLPEAELREQVFHIWSNWMDWAVSNPEKHRALAQLEVSDQIRPESRAAGHETMIVVRGLIERSRAGGPLRESPMAFVVALMNSMVETTINFVLHDPDNAQKHGKAGFDALWRALA